MSGPARGTTRIGPSTHDDNCACGRCVGFLPGNTVALKHGARRSDLALSQEPRVAELMRQIAETQPVSHPADEGAIWRLALTYRRYELSAKALDSADRELAEKPLAAYHDGADMLARLREDHARWLRLAGQIEAELGRTPTSRAKLGLHIALGRRALTVVDLHAEEAS